MNERWITALLCLAATALVADDSVAQNICIYNHSMLEKTKLYQEYSATGHDITDANVKEGFDNVEAAILWVHRYNAHADKAKWLREMRMSEGEFSGWMLSMLHFSDHRVLAMVGIDVQKVQKDHPTPWPVGALDKSTGDYWLKTITALSDKYHKPDFKQKADALFQRIHDVEAALVKQHNAVALIEIDKPPRVIVQSSPVKFIDITQELVEALNR